MNSINKLVDDGKTQQDTSMSVIIENENYTLGNFLRYMLNRKNYVELAGCTIPHPSVSELNFRLQVCEGYVASEVFNEAVEESITYISALINKCNEELGLNVF